MTNITNNSAYIGYYKNPYIDIGGIGKILIGVALLYANTILRLNTFYMEALKGNDISNHCILKAGFKQVNIKNNIIKYKLRLQ